MSAMDTISLHSTRAFLGGVALLQTIASLAASDTDATAASSNALGAVVCAIAWQIYSRMQGSGDLDSSLRYADWTVTTPLMLVEFFILLGIDLRANYTSLAGAILLIVACILLGRRAVISSRTRVRDFVAACVCFVAMVVLVLRAIPEWSSRVTMPLVFLSVWFLYPVVFWMKSPAAFNLLDFVSKGVFGLFAAAKAVT